MNRSDAQKLKVWPTRWLRYGPRGHAPVPKWRRKPSARAKRIAEQELVASVSRETVDAR